MPDKLEHVWDTYMAGNGFSEDWFAPNVSSGTYVPPDDVFVFYTDGSPVNFTDGSPLRFA